MMPENVAVIFVDPGVTVNVASPWDPDELLIVAMFVFEEDQVATVVRS